MSHQKARADILLIMETGNSKSLEERPNFSGGEKCLKLGGLFNKSAADFSRIMEKEGRVQLFDKNEKLGVFISTKNMKALIDENTPLCLHRFAHRAEYPKAPENGFFIIRQETVVKKIRKPERVNVSIKGNPNPNAKKEVSVPVNRLISVETSISPVTSGKIPFSSFSRGKLSKTKILERLKENKMKAIKKGRKVLAYFCPQALYDANGLEPVCAAMPPAPVKRGSSKRLTRSEEQEILTDFFRGVPARKLAGIHDVAPRTIFNVIERNMPERLKRRKHQKRRKVHFNEAYHVPAAA